MTMNQRVKTALFSAVLALGAGQVLAQEASTVTLKSLDGKVVMTGELLGFEAGHYNIVVAGMGLMSIAQDLVTCQTDSGNCDALTSNS